MMNEDDPLAAFLPSKEGSVALITLQYHVLGDDVDEAELGPETLRLRQRYRKKGISRFHMSLSPEFKGTSEDLAKALNDQGDWLSDPINNITSRIGGHLFLKKDTVMCLENRTGLQEDGSWGPIPMDNAEKAKVRRLKEDIELFEEAINMIKDLKAQLDAR